jgi:exopolyphosphatase/guanosine-5'-triphosphate,3'-diphosphate pyrophosphatase
MGGDKEPAMFARLAGEHDLARARAWGLAMRLAQRVTGGAPALLGQSALHAQAQTLVLTLPRSHDALVDPSLERRLERLALALGLSPARIDFIAPPRRAAKSGG